jgi:hypothetical protein
MLKQENMEKSFWNLEKLFRAIGGDEGYMRRI